MMEDNLPIVGLPKSLVMLLRTIVCKNPVKKWKIYNDYSSNICVNICFSDIECNALPEPVSYKRVGINQARRNIARATKYREYKQSMYTTPLPNTQQGSNKKRKISDIPDNSPEINRGTDLTPSQLCIDTPDTVKVDPVNNIKEEYQAEPLQEYDDTTNSLDYPAYNLHPATDASQDDCSVEYECTVPILPIAQFSATPSTIAPMKNDSLTSHPPPTTHLATNEEIESYSSYEYPPVTLSDTLLKTMDLSSETNNTEISTNDTAIYCQCCTNEMTPTHECPSINDGPPQSQPTPVPPDPGPPESRDPKLLELLCRAFRQLDKGKQT